MAAVTLEPISAAAFAPFGTILPSLEIGARRLDLIEELQNLRPSARSRLSLIAIEPKALPLDLARMERHVHSSQAFIPGEAVAYLVLVAPSGADDRPDIGRARAFRVPGDIGINYRAGAWHHPLTALDGPARFVSLTFVDGTEADEDWATLPEALRIVG